MSHPGPLLANYVDGTLGPDVRAEVDAHLEGCETCSDEVRLARIGKRVAGDLPAPVVPPGLAERAIAEATSVAGERNPEVAAISSGSRRRPKAPRWLAVASAAAIIVAIALIAPKLGQEPSNLADLAAPAGGAAAATYPSPTVVEVQQHKNYSFGALAEQARDMQSALRAGTQESAQDGAFGSVSDAPPFGFENNAATSFSVDRLGAATDCLGRAFEQPEGSLVRIVLAKYEGQQAYFGVYVVSPGAGLPSDGLRIDVAAVHGCRILAQSSAKL